MRPRRSWLVPALVVAAGATIGVAALLQQDGSGGGKRSAGESPALEQLPRTGPCLKLVRGSAPDDEGFDVARIAKRVERLRELEFRRQPKLERVSEDEMNELVLEEFEAAYPAGAEDSEERLLAALGAISSGSDLNALREQTLESQVAGFYDPRSKRLAVLADEDPGVLERIVLAHELEHALVDQHFGLPTEWEVGITHGDRILAEAALIEGDASLVEELYLTQHASVQELLGATSVLFELQLEELARVPDFLQREFVFPYVAGAEFACALRVKGGWEALDRAYRDPPRTSAEILFPERYGTAPADPPDPNPPGSPWRLELEGEFGAAPLLWLMKAPGDDRERAVPRARAISAAWAGGELRLWSDGEATAVGIALAARERHGPALCAGTAGWYVSAFAESERAATSGDERLALDGAEQDAVLRCSGEDVRLGIAPSLPLARRIAAR